jgi:hypothetical protein
MPTSVRPARGLIPLLSSNRRTRAASPNSSPSASDGCPRRRSVSSGDELANARHATQLEATASTQFTQATEASQRADNYILLTVLFALVLFFSAVSTRFDARVVQITLLSVGAVVFVVAAVITALYPVEF